MRMELNFFDVLLTLMEEHELWWNIHAVGYHVLFLLCEFLFINFDGKVPKGKFVIRRCNGENRFLSWLKLDWSNRLCVPSDSRNRVKLWSFTCATEHSQVPNSEFTLVISRGEKELCMSVPAHDIYVAIVSLKGHLRLHLGSSKIPKFDSSVHWAGGEDLFLRWTPLDVFDTICVALEAHCSLFDEGRAVFISRGIKVKHGVTRSWS